MPAVRFCIRTWELFLSSRQGASWQWVGMRNAWEFGKHHQPTHCKWSQHWNSWMLSRKSSTWLRCVYEWTKRETLGRIIWKCNCRCSFQFKCNHRCRKSNSPDFLCLGAGWWSSRCSESQVYTEGLHEPGPCVMRAMRKLYLHGFNIS